GESEAGDPSRGDRDRGEGAQPAAKKEDNEGALGGRREERAERKRYREKEGGRGSGSARSRNRPGRPERAADRGLFPGPFAPSHDHESLPGGRAGEGVRRDRQARRGRGRRAGRRPPPWHRQGPGRPRLGPPARPEERRSAYQGPQGEGAAQVRAEEGPQGTAVLQAIGDQEYVGAALPDAASSRISRAWTSKAAGTQTSTGPIR